MLFEDCMMHKKKSEHPQLRVLAWCFLVLMVWIVVRLFILQIVNHNYYTLFASNSHEMYKKLHAERGIISVQDTRTKEIFPIAINREYYLFFAVPQNITADKKSVVQSLAAILQYDEARQAEILKKLSKENDKYEVIEKKVDIETMEKIKALDITGFYFTPQSYRFYPENNLAASVIGFTSFDDNGKITGKYGLEGYKDSSLAGTSGFIEGEKGALGSWITLAQRQIQPAVNGNNLVLTIDRSLQYKACARLQEGFERFGAKSASMVMMNAKTGSVLAMCSFPDFDPNTYSKVNDISSYNNRTIFDPYEPGSVFKPITMAMGLDLGLVSPNTLFTDPCQWIISGKKVKNALGKCYGTISMTQVLENSVNTGAAWVEKKIGPEKFREYVEKFGFGTASGIPLNTEVGGNIKNLSLKPEIYFANASFGQAITVTPLQLAAAYGAIANGGRLFKPYIIEEIQHADGKTEKTSPQLVNQVMSENAAKLLSGMLVSVVEKTYKLHGRLEHYYMAGKTGTAQIPVPGGYDVNKTNHTFTGFGPVGGDDPIAVAIRYEEPNRLWSDSTTAEVFRDVMQFAMQYYSIPEQR